MGNLLGTWLFAPAFVIRGLTFSFCALCGSSTICQNYALFIFFAFFCCVLSSCVVERKFYFVPLISSVLCGGPIQLVMTLKKRRTVRCADAGPDRIQIYDKHHKLSRFERAHWHWNFAGPNKQQRTHKKEPQTRCPPHHTDTHRNNNTNDVAVWRPPPPATIVGRQRPCDAVAVVLVVLESP